MWSLASDKISSPQFTSFWEWLGAVLQQTKMEDFELFCVCAWQIWCARNDLYFEKISITPELCFKRAYDMLVEFRKANVLDIKNSTPRGKPKWIPPANQIIKVNVDAAVNIQEDIVGLGVVARNSLGEVCLAASKTVWPFMSVEMAELSAFLWVVEFVKDKSWDSIVFEGDAHSIVTALNGVLSRGLHAQILVDNILVASTKFAHLEFLFCYREANSVVHRLAKWASASICSSVWLDGGPSWISDIVLCDVPS